MRDGQCELSEGCLRIRVLLDHYVAQDSGLVHGDDRTVYPGIFKLYEQIKDQPTHEARKRCPKQQIIKMDRQRHASEARFKAEIVQDIDKLLERFVAK